MKLTAKKCDAATHGKDPSKLFDGKGLYLFLHKSGSKYWRYKYKSPTKGKEDTLSLGVYPEITLAEAREKHQNAHKLVSEGIDPKDDIKEKQAIRIADANNTFEVIAREWYAHKLPEWSDVNAEQTIKRLEKDVFPTLGNTPIKNISHKDLLELANKVKERGANELAKRIIQMSKHIFQYAIITGRAEKNIAEDLKGLIKPKPTKHFASIESKDIPKFLKDLEKYRPQLKNQTYLAVKFMMLTFVRTGEMIGAEWDEFDLDENLWLVPASRMKMKKEHIVPLSSQTIQILNDLRLLHNHPKYVFPSRVSHDKHMSNNTVLTAVKRMGYAGKMTGHGFRSLAMSTIMERLGYRREIPDAQLAHAKRGDVAKAYERAKYLEERVKMMQDWADYIDGLQLK